MADDIQAQVCGWADDEIGKQRFGQDFAFAVTLGPATMAVPGGQVQVPMWSLLLTTRNPVLKEGPLFHGPVPIGSPRPEEAAVRKHVAEGIRLLRDLAASKLTGLNGRTPVPR